jgi:hypothetical protein
MPPFSPVHMQALDYVFSRTSPAAVIEKNLFGLLCSLPSGMQHAFPQQLTSSPWHTDSHPTMLLFFLFPSQLPFHLRPSSIQYTTIIRYLRRNHIVGLGPVALFVVLTIVVFFISAAWQIPTSGVHAHYCTYASTCVHFSGR